MGWKQVEAEDQRTEMSEGVGQGLAGGNRREWVEELASRQ